MSLPQRRGWPLTTSPEVIASISSPQQEFVPGVLATLLQDILVSLAEPSLSNGTNNPGKHRVVSFIPAPFIPAHLPNKCGYGLPPLLLWYKLLLRNGFPYSISTIIP